MIRLDKFLSNYGIASRSEVKKRLKKGMVCVNGKMISDGKYQVDETKDTITYQGQILHFEPLVYYVFHKPAG